MARPDLESSNPVSDFWKSPFFGKLTRFEGSLGRNRLNFRIGDDSGAVPLNPLKMSLLSEIFASTSAGRRPRVTSH